MACSKLGINGIFRSTNLGQTWQNLGYADVDFLVTKGIYIYGTGYNSNVIRSSDNGSTWDTLSTAEIKNPVVMGGLLIGSGYYTIHRSFDGGYNWDTLVMPFILDVLIVKDNILFGTDHMNNTSYRSIDTGRTWMQLNTFGSMILHYEVRGNKLYGCGKGVLRSTDNGLTWKRRNKGITLLSINALIADHRYIYAATRDGISISKNNGNRWSDLYLLNYNAKSFTKAQDNVLFATDSGVYKTSNNGANWLKILNSNSYLSYPIVLGSNGSDIYFCNYNTNGILKSTNLGSTWDTISSPPGIPHKILGIESTIISGGDSGIYKTDDNGLDWVKISNGLPNETVEDIEIINPYWFAATEAGVYKSSDNGENWILAINGIPLPIWYPQVDLQSSGQKLYFCNKRSEVYVTTDYGENWLILKDSIGNDVWWLTANKEYVFAGTHANVFNGNVSGVYRCKISFMTGLEPITETPSSYLLSQNYPNPFNPSTKIKFGLPKSTHTKLIIYDILGREVATLVNEKLSAGSYTIDWNGSSYPSGVYFYKLVTDNFVNVKKMLLVK